MDHIEIDTDDKPVTVNLSYPRHRDVKSVRIDLVDVRAANAIHVSYDFDRDGWVIKSDMYNIDNPDAKESDELHEVAFIKAWPMSGHVTP